MQQNSGLQCAFSVSKQALEFLQKEERNEQLCECKHELKNLQRITHGHTQNNCAGLAHALFKGSLANSKSFYIFQ